MTKVLCDNCLGRQFSQLLSGYTNKQRGESIRRNVAFRLDAGEKIEADTGNFYGFRFRNAKISPKKQKCFICNDIFEKSADYAEKIIKLLKIDYETFIVGTRPSKEILSNEQKFWEENGIEWTEPFKTDFNRSVGSLIEKITGKRADLNRPDVSVLIDLEKNKITYSINSVFFYGEYNKLVRGIPQTKWPSGKYRNSVEQIIAKDFMKRMKAEGHKLHGAGREDIDARCLGWRPFVLEILEPKVRKIDLRKIKVGKGVKVRNLKYTDSKMPEIVKTLDHDKTYECFVLFEKPIKKSDLSKLSQLKGKVLMQETPTRVKHRRSDLLRRRKIISITWKYVNPKKIKIKVKAQSGTYIKEMISGDDGRTYPSITQIMGVKAVCKDLDVIGFSRKK